MTYNKNFFIKNRKGKGRRRKKKTRRTSFKKRRRRKIKT
jgi:hypothetical protein